MLEAAPSQEALLRFSRVAPQPPPAILDRFADELDRRVQRHNQFVSEQGGGRTPGMAQVSDQSHQHVRKTKADVLPRADSAEMRNFHRREVYHVILAPNVC